MDDMQSSFLGLPHGTTPAAMTKNKIQKLVPLRAVKKIQKKECGPERSVFDNQSSLVTLNKLAMKARKSYCNFKFKQRSDTMTDINPTEVQII